MRMIRNTICSAGLVAILLLTATNAFPYEEDTHFLITYITLRAAGFTDSEALTVAAVDQGMDDSDSTNAHDGAKPQALEEWLWHALDKDGNMHAAGILQRRDALFDQALNERDPKIRLIRLGIFFHYQQDTWAHRHHERDDHLSRDGYMTFDTPAGHAAFGSQPDRPPLDPVAALMSLEDGIAYASDFLSRAMGRTPNRFFKNYVRAGGKIDANWKDGKQGKFFNQIDVSGLLPNSPQLFLASLIRAQITAYPQSRSPHPAFFGKQTADRIDFTVARTALQKAYDDFAPTLGPAILPTQQQKVSQGFTNMRSWELLSLVPGSF
jgi:hypothetical protein